ncbi:PBP1A family penicillin-binding protein [Fredinandcohnia sp. QZ13]|uniref:PBP1A family penicillin-binding protein n=1 Tax=Fredinandcohnia sp. QZ13 TaxID=3073144 RepID=UPI002852F6B1|nr:PBP1A family penicillin-binding protein [Fredinandcohnia sp. QZ13]MDR4888677.1 PBP1A family penicillin-binding protein [Fredinandcohnia sp. QZ13]
MSEKYQSREERRHANQKKKKRKKSKGSLFKRILLIILLIGIIGMVAGATTFFVMASGAPELDESLLKDPLSSKVYDMNGNKIYEFGAEKRTYVSLNQIPDDLKNAVLAVEDARFYEHHGLDVIRLGGAVVANLTEGFGAEGASTISQQVIKNSFFVEGEKKLTRKAQELWLAFQLERKYSKNEILEMYLNKIYYGVGNTYGVAKAAELYFGKPLDELELHESAFIAGLGQNPGIYNPFVHPEAAEKRRNIVLNLMVRHEFITKEQADAAKKVPIESSIVESKEQSHPIDSFMDQVKNELKEYGDIDVYNAGVKIYTTFDPEAQAHVDSLLANENPDIQFPDDQFQAGIAIVDTKTGEIRALGGGRNQAQNTRVNFALDNSNQPGSTIKPILDYGPAIEYLKWSTYHQIKDEPYTYSDKRPINNFDRKFMGQITARVALAHSRNIPALKAFQEVGVSKATEFANNLGITFEERINEAYSIGGMLGGISPLEMAGAYATFGNEGNFIKPHAVTKIVFPDNREVVLAPEPKTAMSEATAFMMTDMLKSVMDFGSGRRYDVSGLQIAGKTGTTNYTAKEIKDYNIPAGGVPDIWFSGYTPSYTVAIWTGYRNNQTAVLPAEQSLALKLFRDIITNLSEGKEAEDFVMPKTVVKVGVEKGSSPAKLPSEFTPKDEIVYEYFIRGTEPTEVSDKYDKLNPPSNLSVMYDQVTNQINLTWAYAEGEMEGNSFEVSVSIDEGPAKVLTTTKELTYTVPDAIPGAIYKFSVAVVNNENPEKRSDPASTTIEVPEPPEEEIDIPLPPGNPGNGNGNGNGGENGGDTGGDTGGEGEGNGEGDGGVPIFPPLPPTNGDRE